ncbi:S41 family peptidase [Streptomyces inhibens]|uniref:S41 family peptidase n=1 Tax=Streptomyces inhibens TaxID=2293571 RepID=UPI001EE70E92|nr:S41 family peptidase [Streptomyces inhibens]UKY49354.1 S41 family peptidase [Streptomyces inhibens]
MNNPSPGPNHGHRHRRVPLLFAALTALTALTATAACTGPARAARSDTDARTASGDPTTARPTHASGASLEGVWRMDGYGTLLTIKGRSLRTYETTAISCLPGSVTGTRTGDPDAHGRSRFTVPDSVPITVSPAGADRARLTMEDTVGRRTLHRIDGLPDRCAKHPPRDPRAVFDVFWQTYAENYPFFRAKKIDWAAVRDRYRPRITDRTTDDELFAVLRKMIEPLHDAHTRVVVGPRQWFAGSRPGTVLPTPESTARIDKAITANLGPGVTWRTWAQGKLAYADLPGRIGYFRVTQFSHYTKKGDYAGDVAELDRALNSVFTKARTRGPAALRGLIIDVRLNGGGADALGLRIASRLTDHPYLAYSKRARNNPQEPGKFTTPQPIQVRPHRGPVYTGPIAVLTGLLTISAGETFTQSLTGRSPAPTRIGENTQGVFSDILDRTLPNGWSFGLPNEEFLTADGHTFDGAGIPPAVPAPVFTDKELSTRRDSALTRAKELLADGIHGTAGDGG